MGSNGGDHWRSRWQYRTATVKTHNLTNGSVLICGADHDSFSFFVIFLVLTQRENEERLRERERTRHRFAEIRPRPSNPGIDRAMFRRLCLTGYVRLSRRFRRFHGQPRRAREAPRVCVSVVRNLRRPQRVFRLRTARRGTEEKHPRLLVERHGPAPRRCRRDRNVHHHAPEGLGGVRSRGRLHRSAGRLQSFQATLPGRPAESGPP